MLMAGDFRGNLLGSVRIMPGFEMRESMQVRTAGPVGGWTLRGDGYADVSHGLELLPGTSLADDIPASTATTTDLAIGSNIRSAIDTVGDHDWVRVELVAGQSYAFSLAGVGSPPLSDAYLDLRDSNGTIIASDDDGGVGYDSLIRFTATSSGTYYLDAHAYDTETGNYRLSADEAAPVGILDSIDWGTQVTGSSFTVYFATSGQRFDGTTAEANWTNAEKAAVMAAFGVYSDVANITFAETNSSGSATFVLLKADLGADTLGYCNPPGEANAGVGVFSHTNSTWTNQSLEPGGYAFVTLIHEFGHGLGLAHPHDNGGSSTVMPGVTASFGSYGTSGLNQGVYTTMSYNDGWASGPNGVNTSQNNYGWQGTLGPLDIALIQEKYGADTSVSTGNTSYELADANAAGTMYTAIWDTAGTDEISYSGSRNAHIDLRAATLLDAVGGGGYVSYVTGIIGGFTIANGVVVENASGGSGDDWLRGNGSANTFTGNGGDDTINGAGGNDIAVYSGAASDYSVTTNGDGTQTVRDLRSGSPDGTDTLTSIETIQFLGDGGTPPVTGEIITGTSELDRLEGTRGDDTISAGAGDDRVFARGGNDTVEGEDGDDRLFAGSGDDIVSGGDGEDRLFGGNGDDQLSGDAGRDDVRGGQGNDTLSGGSGSDDFRGGAGDDRIDGGSGNYDRASYSGNFADYSFFYNPGSDQIRLTDLRDGRPDGVDRLVGVEFLEFADGVVAIGANGAYALVGASDDETLTGGASDDTINAGAGDDRVFGGDGNDTLNGESGADRLFGENGDDIISGGDGEDAIYGGEGADQISGDAGRDDIRGGGGDDTLSGGSGSDDFRGGAGDDYIDGGSGNYDRAIYSGNYADFKFYYNPGSDQVRLTDARDGRPDGVDRLVSVEFLVFDDGVVAVNGGSFDFQPNLQPAGLPSAAEDGPAGQSFASLGVLSAVAKHGQSPVMDILDLSDDAGTFLTRADASGPGYVGDGWSVADPDAELLRAPEPGADWHLLSEAADAAPGDSSVVRLAVVPDVNPADWVTPVDAWEISANDGEARHEPSDVSGWM